MNRISAIGATLLAAAMLCAAPISLHQSQDKGLSLSVDKAKARIGRPLTPGSVAGVHRRHVRRTYRRGYYGGGYYPYHYHGGLTAIATMATITIIGATIITAIAIGSRQQIIYLRNPLNKLRLIAQAATSQTSVVPPSSRDVPA